MASKHLKTRAVKRTAFTIPETGFPTKLDETIIGIDDGNGKTAVFNYNKEKVNYVYIPHGRVPASTRDFDAKEHLVNTVDIPYSDWPSEFIAGEVAEFDRWQFGDGLWKYANRNIETSRNSDYRYGSGHQVWSVINALTFVDAPEETPLTLVMTAPPGLVSDVAKKMKRAFLIGEQEAKDGVWRIRPKGAKKWQAYVVGKVVVVPEGVPSYAAYRFTLDGNVADLSDPIEKGKDALAGRVTVMDIGFGTFDSFDVVDGRINQEGIQTATDPAGGVHEHMVVPVQRRLDDLFDRNMNLPASVIDGWLRLWAANGFTEESAIVDIAGKRLELHDYFVKLSKDYADYVINEKVARAFSYNHSDAILTTGGGWAFIIHDVMQAYKNRAILSPAMYEHTKKVPFHMLNAYGTLVQAAVEIRR